MVIEKLVKIGIRRKDPPVRTYSPDRTVSPHIGLHRTILSEANYSLYEPAKQTVSQPASQAAIQPTDQPTVSSSLNLFVNQSDFVEPT